MIRIHFTVHRVVLIAIVSPVLHLCALIGAETEFEKVVKPILQRHCFDCHADGANEGSMSLDELLAEAKRSESNRGWFKVLKQVQSGLMPPPGDAEPLSKDEVKTLENWIKYSAFEIDPKQPDPGRVTVRRLNRVEYRNTIGDLLGVDYDTDANFPADDTGHGFDNIGSVLSISPLMLEKYVNAATEIVNAAVPQVSGRIRTQEVKGNRFRILRDEDNSEEDSESRRGRFNRSVELSYYTQASARAIAELEFEGEYTIRLNLRANESYVDGQFDENRCQFTFSLDGEEMVNQTFVRQGGKSYTFEFNKRLSKGKHELLVAVEPLTDLRQVRRLRISIQSVEFVGPNDPNRYIKPDRYEEFFPKEVPAAASDRRAYATELLTRFASRAYRRPAHADDVEQLVMLAEDVQDGGGTFEAGIAKAMTAVLASSQFLFREEPILPSDSGQQYPLIDEYALASRLSYLFWSTMPDEELISLAQQGTLRQNLDDQIDRMLADKKSEAFFENFVGQWLRSRAIDVVPISTAAVLSREPRRRSQAALKRRERFFDLVRRGANRTQEEENELEDVRAAFRSSNGRRGPRFELTNDIRTAMRRETEMLFEHIVRRDRPLTELINADYTFLNQSLAEHYEIPGIEIVQGDEMRRVELPKNSLRGGVLTQGTTLVVTSNPDRTSPVKRGLFVLENLLGTPTPAPPPNIPALEDVKAEDDLSLRETLALHRENALCSSCHNRMDPLGLALENFNALGRFRTEELDQEIDSSGELATGETFESIDQLKKILVSNRRGEFYRCVTEKLMTYTLGREIEYSDAHTVDELVTKLESSGGKPSALLRGLLHSSAFQRTRRLEQEATASAASQPNNQRR